MATIKDVSKLAGVSIATVSRVLNGSARVTPEKRTRVEQAMRQLRFHPNQLARSLVQGRSDCIGLMVGDLGGSPFFMQMMRGVEAVLEMHGKMSIVVTGHHRAQRERQAIEQLLLRKCDALILHCKALADDELVELLDGVVPYVLVNRRVASIEAHCVDFDNHQGARLAMQHLLEQGHRQIGYLHNAVVGFSDAQARLQGIAAVAQAAALDWQADSHCAAADPDERGGYHGMAQLMARNPQLTAVCCFNDAMAIGAMAYLQQAGIRVPQDVSVVGFDDTPFATITSPQLTTVRYPIEQMGRHAAELALRLCGSQSIQGKCFSPALVVRDSVRTILA